MADPPGESKTMVADEGLIAIVRLKLSAVARAAQRLENRDERSALWRAFWLELPPAEWAAWPRVKLAPAHARWQATMSPEERLEQRGKISEATLAEDRSSRNVRMWAARSPDKRKATAAAISAGQKRYWDASGDASGTFARDA
jgi:hypothetical protein